MFSAISKFVRKLPIFNPFDSCLETFEPLPNIIPAVPTILVEAVWDKWIVWVTLFMVAIVFDYMRGYDPEWGALGFLFLWITNSLFVKGIVWSAGSLLGFVSFTFLYVILIKFLYGCFHNSETASSAPPHRTNEK